ncbi:hypothetical protein F4779DRAFT_317066 [Xylariaceae sp. FL0662B]|nr:hypothetical protein F4779DRAFT_317066 [Xylariaceae sp. FL0662B]
MVGLLGLLGLSGLLSDCDIFSRETCRSLKMMSTMPFLYPLRSRFLIGQFTNNMCSWQAGPFNIEDGLDPERKRADPCTQSDPFHGPVIARGEVSVITDADIPSSTPNYSDVAIANLTPDSGIQSFAGMSG